MGAICHSTDVAHTGWRCLCQDLVQLEGVHSVATAVHELVCQFCYGWVVGMAWMCPHHDEAEDPLRSLSSTWPDLEECHIPLGLFGVPHAIALGRVSS